MVHRVSIKGNFIMLVIGAGFLAGMKCGMIQADQLLLQNGTATYSQGMEDGLGPYSPDEAVDGLFQPPLPGNGWAIANASLDDAISQTAVWETSEDMRASCIQFDLDMVNMLGHFRISVTSDLRSDFADGLDSGGDVEANWVVLNNPVVTGPAGMDFIVGSDGSVLVDVNSSYPVAGIVSVQYSSVPLKVTGIRLEALEHPSLPHDGPGLTPQNGNFLVVEMTVHAVTDTAPVQFTRLGDLPGGAFDSMAIDVSDDGLVVVGKGSSSIGSEAIRWTEEGGMTGLGDLPGGAVLGTVF